jgi:hypothetical protein
MQKSTPSFVWPSVPALKSVDDEIASWIRRFHKIHNDWEKIDENSRLHRELCYDLNDDFGDQKLSFHQIASLRHNVLIGLAQKGSYRLETKEVCALLIQMWSKGAEMKEICNEINASPTDIIKVALREVMKMSQGSIAKCMRHPDKMLSDHADIARIKWANDHDIMSHVQADLFREIAHEKEMAVERLIQSKNITFRTETQLRQAGSHATPDIVLNNIVFINNKPVRWIEVKGGFGTRRTSILNKKMQRQFAKYVKTFGAGAVVWISGFSQNLNFGPSVQFLDFRTRDQFMFAEHSGTNDV